MENKYTLISYGPDTIDLHSSNGLDDILSQVQESRVTWVTLRGYDPSDRPDVERLLAHFGAESNVADAIFKPRPLESSDQLATCLYLNYIVPGPVLDRSTNAYVENSGSIVVGDGYLLLFDEIGKGFYDFVQTDLLRGNTRAQGFGVDYLLYMLVRAAIYQIDQLISVELVRRFDALEDDMFANPGKKDSLKALLAEREHVKALYDPLRWIDLFLTSVREGDIRVITPETIELFTQNLANDLKGLEDGYLRLSDWVSELLDLYQTYINERTNSLLQILSTIFLPLTFISGVYGMNFVVMPGVNNPYGFYISLVVMFAIVGVMLFVMKKKEWL